VLDTGTAVLNDLVIAKTDYRYNLQVVGTAQVGGDLEIVEVKAINDGVIKVAGDLVSSDPSVAGTGTITLNGDHLINGAGQGGRFPNILVESTGMVDATAAEFIGVESLTVAAGEFLAPANAELRVYNQLVVTDGLFNHGYGTVILDGRYTHQVLDTGTAQLNNLVIAKADYRYNLQVIGMAHVDGDLEIVEVKRINDGIINIGGDLISSDPSVEGTATIEMNGDHIINPAGELAGKQRRGSGRLRSGESRGRIADSCLR